MTYSVRPMDREDLPQINEIDREAFPTQWPPANYRQELQNKLAHYLVVYDDSRKVTPPAGLSRQCPFRLFNWLSSLLRHRSPRDDSPPEVQHYIAGFSGIWLLVDEAHITNIAVRQQYQGKGIGELLLIATIDLARELKACTMTLEVRASNKVAQNLYSKYGFAQTGLRRGYYLDNREDAIIMSTDDINSDSFQAHLQQRRQALATKLK
ncbi:MAG: ribosomal-protein-alanine N-acetyltransferase [Chloroflexi bacterium RBG_16_56_11]|nr:MAG: ribosomal-protein-alanine N-acetyltransferase [Chloroflexi bacterium RBG_16_56_11]